MKCKPGDLAYIVRCRTVPEIVGRIVEVIRLVPAGEFTHPELGRVILSTVCWEFKYVGASGFCRRQGGGKFQSRIAFMKDENLRPISGVPVHDEEHNEVTA